MIFMPGDDPLIGPVSNVSTIASVVASDWVKQKTDPNTLICEAEELLKAVDLAISRTDFAGDAEGEQMQRSWAFIGPGLHRAITEAKILFTRIGSKVFFEKINSREVLHVYLRVAMVTMALTTRRQTLELNEINVLGCS
jgi:hypothetical protein